MSADSDAAREDPGASSDAREVEWQLQAPDLAAVQCWLESHASVQGLLLEPRPTLQLLDTYLDTDDWRIHRAGFALRMRKESGNCVATLKSLHSAREQIADRRELTESLADADPARLGQLTGPVGSRVGAVVGLRPLRALFEVRTSRHRFVVHREDEATPLGEIALDETRIAPTAGGTQTSIQRVEVEALTETHEPLQALVDLLRSDCALEPATDSKFALGLRAADLTPTSAAGLEPASPAASMSMESLAKACLRRCLNAWNRHEPGARLGDDAEELHELRVAGRRLAAALSLFRAHLPPALNEIRPALKSLLSVLGEARDFDLALSELDAFSLELSNGERAGVQQLRAHLCEQRAQARARMLSMLDSDAVRNDFGKLLDALREPPLAATENDAAAPALEMLPALIRGSHRKLRKRAERLTARSSVEQYHTVRRRVKKLRYVIESVAGLYGKPAQQILRSLRRLQEKLGIQHDADVANQRLRRLAAVRPDGIPPETLFLMGRLAERQAVSALRARKRFVKAYRKVSGRSWKALKARMAAASR